MQIVYRRCCGMDVHKDSVTACLLLIDDGGEFQVEKRRFGTMTRDLKEMASWLEARALSGLPWKPQACTGSRCGTSWNNIRHSNCCW